MSVKDVKEYYYRMQAQYLEMKADLADFEQALENDFITEDELNEVKENVAQVEANYERLSFIMYLLEMPNRPAKKDKYKESNKKLIKVLANNNATTEQIEAENRSALDTLRAELKKLKKVDSN